LGLNRMPQRSKWNRWQLSIWCSGSSGCRDLLRLLAQTFKHLGHHLSVFQESFTALVG
jgi:hypothetical protein